jgi:hypothetical protein
VRHLARAVLSAGTNQGPGVEETDLSAWRLKGMFTRSRIATRLTPVCCLPVPGETLAAGRETVSVVVGLKRRRMCSRPASTRGL